MSQPRSNLSIDADQAALHIDIARRLNEAMNAHDLDAYLALYAPDATAWHNFEQTPHNVADEVAFVRELLKQVPDLRYEDSFALPTPMGFVEQHVNVGHGPRGALRVPVVEVATIENGLVKEMRAYLDPAQWAKAVDMEAAAKASGKGQ